MDTETIKARVAEIDAILFNKSISLSDIERKSLETEKNDLIYYLE